MCSISRTDSTQKTAPIDDLQTEVIEESGPDSPDHICFFLDEFVCKKHSMADLRVLVALGRSGILKGTILP